MEHGLNTEFKQLGDRRRPFGKPIYITRHGPHPWAGDFDNDGQADLLCYTEWSVYPFYAHAALTLPERPAGAVRLSVAVSREVGGFLR